MRKLKLLSTILVASFLLFGCNDSNKQHNQKKSTKKILDPNKFTLSTLKEETITVKKNGDGYVVLNSPKKIVLFDIYATWCPPCRIETKTLSNLAEKYKDNLVVIGVSVEEFAAKETLQSFKSENNINYPLTLGSENKRFIDSITETLHIGKHFPIPLMALYKDGKLLNSYSGMTEEEFIASDIKKALGK